MNDERTVSLVFGVFITILAIFATLFMVSEWNTRLQGWTEMQVFTLQFLSVSVTAFSWFCAAVLWRDILARRDQ